MEFEKLKKNYSILAHYSKALEKWMKKQIHLLANFMKKENVMGISNW